MQDVKTTRVSSISNRKDDKMIKVTAQQLYERLKQAKLDKYVGEIIFELAGVKVKINTTDTVGITLQSWLKQYLELQRLS